MLRSMWVPTGLFVSWAVIVVLALVALTMLGFVVCRAVVQSRRKRLKPRG